MFTEGLRVRLAFMETHGKVLTKFAYRQSGAALLRCKTDIESLHTIPAMRFLADRAEIKERLT
jgi:hypothetical protein